MEKSGYAATSRPLALSPQEIGSRGVETSLPLDGVMLGDKVTGRNLNQSGTIDIFPVSQSGLQETKSRPGVQRRGQIPLKLDADA